MLSYYIPSTIYTEQIHGISHLLANIEYNIELSSSHLSTWFSTYKQQIELFMYLQQYQNQNILCDFFGIAKSWNIVYKDMGKNNHTASIYTMIKSVETIDIDIDIDLDVENCFVYVLKLNNLQKLNACLLISLHQVWK